MILPITAYGDPVLRKKGADIDRDHPGLQELIQNMFETMYNAQGVGLAAPQVGKAIRLFIVDASPFEEEYPETKDFSQVFINPVILNLSGDKWKFNEGCLSIPGIREDIERRSDVTLRYFDENFELYEEDFSGIIARIILHEYDHIEGKLFVDYLSPLKKTLIRGKLNDITRGYAEPSYKMKYKKP
jgi:peptide deformylase